MKFMDFYCLYTIYYEIV